MIIQFIVKWYAIFLLGLQLSKGHFFTFVKLYIFATFYPYVGYQYRIAHILHCFMYVGSPLHSKWFEPLSTYSLKIVCICFMMFKLYKKLIFVDNEYRFLFLFSVICKCNLDWTSKFICVIKCHEFETYV